MKNHYTSLLLHISLDLDMQDYYVELPQQATCSRERQIRYSKKLPNVFGIANEILVVGYYDEGTHHDRII